MKHITHWIGGKPWTGEASRHGNVYDPAAGQLTGTVDFATAAEADAAVAAATGAFPAWRQVSLARRSQVLFAFRELVRQHIKDLAALITSRALRSRTMKAAQLCARYVRASAPSGSPRKRLGRDRKAVLPGTGGPRRGQPRRSATSGLGSSLIADFLVQSTSMRRN